MSHLATDCARARESVSLQLDGELAEFELDRLETHLRICPACAAWAEEVRDVTLRLREAALEVPAERFVLPRRSRRWAVSSAVALASAAAVVATMFVAPAKQQASLGSLPHVVVLRSTPGERVSAPRTQRLDDSLYASLSAPESATVRSTGRVAV